MLGLCTSALGVGLGVACSPTPSASRGSRVVATPTYGPDDQRLVPRRWKETRIKVGGNVGSLTALHFIQELQIPEKRIPFIMSMTFFAPKEVPLVTIGLYYEKGDNAAAKDLLTGPTLCLQQIDDLDAPLSLTADHLKTVQSEQINGDQLAWFEKHRKAVVDEMRNSSEGLTLSKSWDSNFTTRARPPAGKPAALVITGGKYAGFEVPYTVVGQRIVFVGA